MITYFHEAEIFSRIRQGLKNILFTPRENNMKNYHDIIVLWYQIVGLRDFRKYIVIFHLKLAENVKVSVF